MSGKKLKLRRDKHQRMTLEQARSTIQEAMPEVTEVVRQHAQSTQQALDLIGQIMSARDNVNGMTLEQARSTIQEAMPEVTEVVRQHAQSTQQAIDRAGQIMSARDNVNGMTLEQARSTIQEAMPEVTEVVRQHAQSTQQAIDRAGQIMSARDNVNGMTLEQARSTIQEAMPEAAEVVRQHAQSTQQAIDRAGQIMSARDNVNGMTLEQARSTIQEAMPEAAEVVLEHTQRVQKILGLVDGIMKYVRAISEAITKSLAPGRQPRSERQDMTLEQARGVIQESMPEAAEVVRQHAQSTQQAIDLIGRIMSARDNVNGMTLEQARSTIQETMPEAAEVVRQHAQSTQQAIDLIGQIMSARDNVNGMTLEQARSTIQETMPEAAEVVQQHAQSTQQALELIGQIMSAHDSENGMTLEQARSTIQETMPEAAEVVRQHAQSTQQAIDRAGQIMSARDSENGMTLEQARSTIQETMPEAAEVVQQHAQSTQQALDLIGRIMSARDNMNGEYTRHFNEFKKLLKNDYREFARNDTYPEEAEAYAALEIIRSHMNQMRLAPRLASRNICTVAGSFSSGKSSFLNALIGDEILPTKVTPTTSIPTFITHVDENELEINVFNSGGGKTPINTSTFQQMTHEFEKDYGIPLKQIVERVVINTPHLERCKQVAFIDTPGYTKPDDAKSDEEDKKIALQEVLTNPFLIWVVDCDRGTLPQEDVDFLCEFREQRKHSQLSSYRKSQPPIFIVLNKADKKLTAQQEVLSNAEKVADKNKLPYFGIGLYSSLDREWYGHSDSGRSFDNFLDMIDRAKTMVKLDEEIEDLFDKYVRFHEKEHKRMQNIVGLLSRIDLIIESPNLRSAVSKYRQDVTERRNEHKGHANQSKHLKRKFGICTRDFVDEIKAMQNA